MTQYDGLNLISFCEYQNFAETTDIIKGTTARIGHLQYLALGLNGEAGEVADKVKKIVRDKGGAYTAADEDAVAKELGDVLWYLARMADVLNYTLDTVALDNVNKLRSRQGRGTLGGSGDSR